MIAEFLIIATLAQPVATPPEPVRDDTLVLRINLPAYQLEVWDGDERIRTYDATIGAPGYATPGGDFSVTRIVWNPWWHPPESRWARGSEKTPPGPGNPMGRAKLQFDRLLYVHGTSKTGELGQASSHGCIRISNEDVLDLARLVAGHAGVLDEGEIDALEASPRRTLDVALPSPVRLEVHYRLVEEVGGEIREHEDVYRRGKTARDRWLLEERPSGAGLASGSTAGATGR